MNELPPTESLDPGLQAVLVKSCAQHRLSYQSMPSGALHDAAVVANHRRSDGSTIPVGTVFIPCRDGLSHNPKEYAASEWVRNGSLVLAEALGKIGRPA